jgi:putative tryptophan/tyrosine transport system substrate-binding protein
MKKNRVLIGVVAVVVLAGAILLLNQKPSNPVGVGIIEPMVHMAISDVTRGVQEGLKAETDVKCVVSVKNANGDSSVIPQIIAQYRDAGVRVFVPIFTGTSQATKKAVGENPIVFAAVTDPVAADLVKNPKSPEGNITGVSDLWPIGAQFDLIRQILPGATRVGILFDPNDPSSAATMPMIRDRAQEKGFVIVERPVHTATEVADALPGFKGKVDAMFTANDVTVTKSFPALVAYCIENKIPLFAGDHSSVQRGAIAAVGQNYYTVGREAAKLVAAICRGEPVAKLPVRYTQGGDLHLNLAAAEKMGVKVPDAVRNQAKQTYTAITEGDSK